ncbi:MAG: 1,2-phenylacetyl-CoA epoxidase subunit PaaC [Bacteroidota bacterium]
MVQNNKLLEYCLRLADTSLILGQRLGEWCGHGPILEEDIAMTNISLDCIGQARGFYGYAAQLEGLGKTEDDYAYLRDEREFMNLLIVEQPNGDFGQTMLRQFLVSAFQFYLYEALKNSADNTIAALAEKSLKEVTYHLRHSTSWVIRLGDGTEDSKRRMEGAIDSLWMYTGDMFDKDTIEETLLKDSIAADTKKIKPLWENKVREVFSEASLNVPENIFMMSGSRLGKHTENLGFILAEMQSLHRAHPGAEW